jgi:hypothetical protein
VREIGAPEKVLVERWHTLCFDLHCGFHCLADMKATRKRLKTQWSRFVKSGVN